MESNPERSHELHGILNGSNQITIEICMVHVIESLHGDGEWVECMAIGSSISVGPLGETTYSYSHDVTDRLM